MGYVLKMDEVKYCNVCGKKLTKTTDGMDNFDIKTGERKYRKICLSSMCGHYGVFHKWEELEKPKFSLINFLLNKRYKTHKCSICGELEWCMLDTDVV